MFSTEDVDEFVLIVNAGALEANCGCSDGFDVAETIAVKLGEWIQSKDPEFDVDAFFARIDPHRLQGYGK